MSPLRSTKQIADKYGFTVGQLTNWRYLRKGPPFVVIYGRAYYREKDVEFWINERIVQSA